MSSLVNDTEFELETKPLTAKDRLKQNRMNKEQRFKAMASTLLLFNLICAGQHHILYGKSGGGKTTVALKLMWMILQEHPLIEVYYLYMDGELKLAAEFMDALEENNLHERFHLITNGSADENLKLIEQAITEGEDPKNMVVVLDTLKFLNPKTLDKTSNAIALHRIKQLTQKGLTFVSLHHTNKSDDTYAGTAEIEQDSDALLLITTADADAENHKISTISEGGRIRFNFESKSFKFERGNPVSVDVLDEVVDTATLARQQQDASVIAIIRGILNIEGAQKKTDLEKMVKEDDDFDSSARDLKRILKDGIDKFWAVHKTGERNHIHLYKSIDHTSQTIDNISNRLKAP